MTILCLHLKATLPQLMIQLYTGKSRNNLARTTDHPTNRLTNPPALSLGFAFTPVMMDEPSWLPARAILLSTSQDPNPPHSLKDRGPTLLDYIPTSLKAHQNYCPSLLITHPLTNQPALQPTYPLVATYFSHSLPKQNSDRVIYISCYHFVSNFSSN